MTTEPSNLMKTILNKAAILAAADLKTIEVDVPEWGGTVLVKSMTGAERDAFEDSITTVNADGTRTASLANYRAKLVAACVVDEAGDLLFGAEDIVALGKKSAAALQRCFDTAQRVNKMESTAVADAKND